MSGGGGGGGFGGRGGGGRGGPGGGGGISSASATHHREAGESSGGHAAGGGDAARAGLSGSRVRSRQGPARAALENVRPQPEQLAAELLQRHLSPFAKGDAQYQPTREEQLAEMKKVTLDDVKKFHDQFYGASHGEFVVVGRVDQAAVQKLAAELLGSWNTPGPTPG